MRVRQTDTLFLLVKQLSIVIVKNHFCFLKEIINQLIKRRTRRLDGVKLILFEKEQRRKKLISFFILNYKTVL